MTIHKSQGSQAREVTVLLPPADSRLLTRELFYTAITRRRERVLVVGTERVRPPRRPRTGPAASPSGWPSPVRTTKPHHLPPPKVGT